MASATKASEHRAARARETSPVLADTLRRKLEELDERQEELAHLLGEAEVVADRERFASLSREFSERIPVVRVFAEYRRLEAELAEARALADDKDEELRQLARDDMAEVGERMLARATELKTLLIPTDERDGSNVFLEIRAGTGGDEAALFAGDLYRMYARYADARGWRLRPLSESAGEQGGFREVVLGVEGEAVYGALRYESGIHRVQRVPETEAKGRIHTSACTVAVLPEVDQVTDVEVARDELRVDTFRASGAGGQHVNKTDSAVRLTHLPTGIVVECQDERSQLKNRARAMQLLQARLVDAAQERQKSEQAAERRAQVGSGDRSEKIRTYNYPQGRVTDHRINLTLHSLTDVMSGELDQLILPLRQERQADALRAMGEA